MWLTENLATGLENWELSMYYKNMFQERELRKGLNNRL